LENTTNLLLKTYGEIDNPSFLEYRKSLNDDVDSNMTKIDTFAGTTNALLAGLIKGEANGVAELDGTGRVPATQLPSYVDDVLEYATFSTLPVTGESGKIYITIDDNLTFRWSGVVYANISSSLALGNTADSAFRGDYGSIAYSHSQVAHAPSDSTANDTDANLKDRANHTGTQTSSTISDFLSSVMDSVLTGLITNTNSAIVATDNVLSALGKLQKQITDHLVDTIKHITATERVNWGSAFTHSETIHDKTFVGLGNVDNTTDLLKPVSTLQQTALDGKVDDSQVLTDVPVGALFTDNDTVYEHPATHSADILVDGTTNKVYTAAEKTKLGGISGTNTGDQDLSGKQNLVPATGQLAQFDMQGQVEGSGSSVISILSVVATKVDKVTGKSLVLDTEITKLGGVADGAEVNVQSDWNAVSGDAQILNKPAPSSGKRTSRFVIGISTAGWTASDCDYLCDGTADQVEINAAITALPANGGEIVILDGTYNITAKINVNKSNVSIRGNGNATILKRMYNSAVDEGIISLTSVNYCKISNLQIDGNKVAYTSYDNRGIYLSSSSDNTITGNTCSSNTGYSISLSSSSNNIITGNTCSSNGTGIYLYSSNDNTITGNTCSSNGTGIRLSSSSDNNITGNTCSSNTDYSIYLSSSSNNYNLISSNQCMGKAVVISGGTSNTNVNNKFE